MAHSQSHSPSHFPSHSPSHSPSRSPSHSPSHCPSGPLCVCLPQALNTLQEAIQGPCFENQLALVRSNFLSITQRMLASLPYDEDEPLPRLRHPPDTISGILSYTAIGARPAGGMDCPEVSLLVSVCKSLLGETMAVFTRLFLVRCI